MFVIMMVFNVCVNDTVQLLYISINLLEDLLLIDHVTHLCCDDCITMVQNRYQHYVM